MATEDTIVKVICSCLPGVEQIAVDEVKERLQRECKKEIRGRISLDLKIKDIPKLSQLRSTNHCWVVVSEIENAFSKKNQPLDDAEQYFLNLAESLQWEDALEAWRIYKRFDACQIDNPSLVKQKKLKLDNAALAGKILETRSYDFFDSIKPLSAKENLSFRVSVTRTGEHSFKSPFVERHFGASVNDFLNWKVDLTNFDIEVVGYILDESFTIGIKLTQDCQALRNLTHFGPTNLRSNISYCLLKLSGIESGDIVCDPMCGSGSISLEGARGFPKTFHFAGDNHEKAVENARDNYNGVEDYMARLTEDEKRISTIPMSVLRWDIYHLPLRTGSVDRVVSDLPFGKKIGTRDRNLFLYPNALYEMARICRPKGKAVLLTQHKKAMWKALMICPLWKMEQCTKINMGGMKVSVYILRRTGDQFTPREHKKGTTEALSSNEISTAVTSSENISK